jgi:hypothetical protein
MCRGGRKRGGVEKTGKLDNSKYRHSLSVLGGGGGKSETAATGPPGLQWAMFSCFWSHSCFGVFMFHWFQAHMYETR